MTPALNGPAFLLLSAAIGLGGYGLVLLPDRIKAWRDKKTEPAITIEFGEPDPMGRILIWTAMTFLAAALLNHVPSLHPGLETPPWAYHGYTIGFLLIMLSEIIRKADEQVRKETNMTWGAVGACILAATAQHSHAILDLVHQLWR